MSNTASTDQEDRVKIYVPDDRFVWMSADVMDEPSPGVYEIEITDVDFEDRDFRRTVRLKDYKDLSAFPLQNEGIGESGVDDMTTLNYLHEASILHNLRKRFGLFLPYTYTGEICIAINPYRWLDIYTEQLREKHVGHLRHELEPHVYATSAAAYRGLRDYQRNQSILVSGESGAGKTETVKILMGHIAHISGRRNDSTIEKVLQANPLLESFGNAKTQRNDNSSRFGKFTQLQFDLQCLLAGSKCVTYLLEKSRVVTQNDGERNYHIFHQLFAAPPEVLRSVYLDESHCSDFKYTQSGDTSTTVIEGETDGARFVGTMDALALLGVNEETRTQLVRVLAGILYLGQVEFVGDADHSTVDPNSSEDLRICCELLGLEEADFRSKTVNRKLWAEGAEMDVPLSSIQASDSRDALAKEIYDKTFLWLVEVINTSTAVSNPTREMLEANRGKGFTIALLDIFGFETFELNRFEQLCINFANEKLQQKFTQDVFQAVQQEYKDEGLQWESIGYKDNSDVLELLEGKLGILDLLNEECMVPKGNDLNFRAKLITNCKHPCFAIRPKNDRDEFTVRHFAGEVSYCVNQFVERNRDTLPNEMASLVRGSSNAVIKQAYGLNDAASEPESARAGRRSAGAVRAHTHQHAARQQSFMKADSVTTKFRSQLDKLMLEIGMTDVQYVRCIKPNGTKSSKVFDRTMIVSQLRYAGVIEAIRISRAAYPYRVTHHDFLARFGKVCPRLLPAMRAAKPKEKCEILLKGIWPDANNKGAGATYSSGLSDKAYEIGKTKVYFSSGILEHLEAIRSKLMFNHIVTIQRCFRGSGPRKHFRRLRAAAAKVGAWYKSIYYHRIFVAIAKLVWNLQMLSRSKIARRKVRNLRILRRVGQLQSWARMVKHRKPFLTFRRHSNVIRRWLRTLFLSRRWNKRYVQILHDKQLSVQLAKMQERLDEERAVRENLEAVAAEQREQELSAIRADFAEQIEHTRQQALVEVDFARKTLEEEKQRIEAEKSQSLSQLEQENVIIAEELNETKRELDGLLRKIETAVRNRRDAATPAVEEWRVDPTAVVLSAEERNQELAAVESTLAELNRLREERDRISAELEEKSDLLKYTQEDHDMLARNEVTLTSSVVELQESLAAVRASVAALSDEKRLLENSFSDLEQELSYSRAEVDSLKATSNDVTVEKVELEALALRLKSELEKTAGVISQKEAEIRRLQNEAAAAYDEVNSAKSAKERAENDQKRIDEYLLHVQEELVRTNDEKENFSKQLEESEKLLLQAQDILSHLAVEKSQLLDENKRLAEEKSGVENALLIMQEELATAQEDCKALVTKNKEIKELERGVVSQLNALKSEHEQTLIDLEAARSQEAAAEGLQQELATALRQNESLSLDLSKLKQQVDDLLKPKKAHHSTVAVSGRDGGTTRLAEAAADTSFPGEMGSSAPEREKAISASDVHVVAGPAFNSVQTERDVLAAENEKLARLLAQYKVEKQYMMVSLHEWTEEVDELNRQKEDLQSRFLVECQRKASNSKELIELLASRGVPPTILTAVQKLVNEQNADVTDGSDHWDDPPRRHRYRRSRSPGDREETDSVISSVSTHRETARLSQEAIRQHNIGESGSKGNRPTPVDGRVAEPGIRRNAE